ncbi:VanW family protein [Candidatus Gracilibacteria bacterium]|jgi:vancomycin resistance protein YoaR|nr:VanW family protein [Candidatus Gracilibacteria bacterium]
MKIFKKIILSVLVGTISGMFFAAAVLGARIYLDGKLPRGTVISGVRVGFLTKESAEKLLFAAEESFLNKEITISVKEKTAVSTMKNLGIEFATKETIEDLKTIDSKDKIFPDFSTKGETKNLIVKIDVKKLIKELDDKLKIKEFYPKSAIFYVDEKKNLLIKEGEAGYVIKEEKLIKEINQHAEILTAGDLKIEISPAPPEKNKEDLEKERPEMINKLSNTITLNDPVYRDNWYLKPLKRLDWVEFEWREKSEDAENFIAVTIKKEKLNEFLDAEVSKWLDVKPDDVNISTNEKGEVVITGVGKDGMKIQREKLLEDFEKAVNETKNEIEIPIEKIVPKITVSEDLQKLGIKERLSVGHTSYYGSPINRQHNIKTGAEKFNGKIVKPEETFSFNKNLGKVDGTTGYRKELVIKPEGTIPEFGGGICQVSTTMYRAILFAGLPVVERNEHTYAVSYYSQVLGHGLDATIYLGGADLKFLNDTKNSILIQTYVDKDNELYFIFYGTSDGRSVEMKGPEISGYKYPGETVYETTQDLPKGETKQVEKAHTGFDVLWKRILTFKDGTKKEEEIRTHYKAVPNKILVGDAGNSKDSSIVQ